MNKGFFGFTFFMLTLAIGFIFFSEKHPRNVQAYWRKWDEVAGRSSHKSQRSPAGSSTRQCLTFETLPQYLKKRIEALDRREASASKEIISNLHLDKLTQQEVQFLKSFSSYIYPSPPGGEECGSLPCFFEKVYGQADQLEGLSIYNFYLETGYAIASSSDIPKTMKLDGYGDDQYLFSRKELNYFNEIVSKISPMLKFMPSLNTIHRLPKGVIMGGYKNACGINSSNYKSGYILLMDKCLIPAEGTTSVIHEMAHSLDKIILKDYSNFSESSEWLDLSGWFIVENKNASGKIERSWSTKKEKRYEGFVTEYASENPREDFAEALGFFVTDPRRLWKASPKKFDLIKNRFFDSRSFDDDGQIEWYSNQLALELHQNFAGVVKSCLEDRSSYSASKIEVSELDNEALSDDLLACLKGGMQALQSKKIDSIVSSEIGTCHFFEKYEKSLIADNIRKFASSLKSQLSDETLLAQEQIEYEKFQNSVLEEVEPREHLLDCLKNANPNGCYTEKVATSISLSARNFPGISPALVEKQKNYFLKQFSYDVVKNDSIRLFKSLFDQSSSTILRWAQERWDSCMKGESLGKGELLIPFSGDGQFVSQDVLTCLNFNATPEILSILTKRAKRLGFAELTSANNDFLLEIYTPVALNFWQSKTMRSAEIESEGLAIEKERLAFEVERSILKNAKLKSLKSQSPDKFLAACQNESQNILLAKLNKNQAFSKLKFNINTQLAGTMSGDLCSNVIKAGATVETTKKDVLNRDEDLQKMFLSYLDLHWTDVEKNCSLQFSSVKKKKSLYGLMKVCLENKISWQKTHDLAFKDMREGPSISLSSAEEASLQKWFIGKQPLLKKKALEKSLSKFK